MRVLKLCIALLWYLKICLWHRLLDSFQTKKLHTSEGFKLGSSEIDDEHVDHHHGVKLEWFRSKSKDIGIAYILGIGIRITIFDLHKLHGHLKQYLKLKCFPTTIFNFAQTINELCLSQFISGYRMFLPAVEMAFLLCQTKVKTHAACLNGHLLHSLIICVGVQISLGKMIILSRQACPLNLLLHITQFKHIRNLRDLIFQASRREPWSSGYGRRLRFQRL